MHRRALILCGLALLAGCATAPVLSTAEPRPELEALYSAVAGREALTIEVASNGCTHKEDFAFYLERKGSSTTLSFGRKRLDPCRSFAMGKTAISFTWTELGLDGRTPLMLLNPLAAWTGPGARESVR
jgi:hypothetical protein